MAEKMQDRRQPDAAQIVRAATPSLGYQTDITNAEPKPRCGFRLRRTVPGKRTAFCASPKRHLFRSLFLHLFQDVWISSFTGRRPDHMRGLEAVCVQKFCRFPDSVLRGEMELIYKRVLLIF